mmetsp:Transcript_30749/g.74188  ORF Transcript_30749/g.74188 Transcript_30749/m.74188 type:complete len:481 (+) Transcript_30749:89-1531(+)
MQMATLQTENIKPEAYEKYSDLTPEQRGSKVQRLAAAETFSERAYEEGPKGLAKMAFKISHEDVEELRGGMADHGGKWRWHYHCACLLNIALKRLLLHTGSTTNSALLRFGRDCFSNVHADDKMVHSATLRHHLEPSPLLEYLATFVAEYEKASGYVADWAKLFRILAQDAVADPQRQVKRAKSFQEHLWWAKNAFEFCFAKEENNTLLRGAEWQVCEINFDNNDDLHQFLDWRHDFAPSGEPSASSASGAAGVSSNGLGGGAGPGAASSAGADQHPDLDMSGGIDDAIDRVNGLVYEQGMKNLLEQSASYEAGYKVKKETAMRNGEAERVRKAALERELKECEDKIKECDEEESRAEEALRKLARNKEKKILELAGLPRGEGAPQTPEQRRLRDEDEDEESPSAAPLAQDGRRIQRQSDKKDKKRGRDEDEDEEEEWDDSGCLAGSARRRERDEDEDEEWDASVELPRAWTRKVQRRTD